MARLYRPRIPFEVRCVVAMQQINGGGLAPPPRNDGEGAQAFLARLLTFVRIAIAVPADARLELDHDPALGRRLFNKRTKKYTPDANDPTCLCYREKSADHDVKTFGRGRGTTLGSDVHEISKTRRLERELAGKPKRKRRSRPIRSAGFSKGAKHRIPSRPFPSGRKLSSRPWRRTDG